MTLASITTVDDARGSVRGESRAPDIQGWPSGQASELARRFQAIAALADDWDAEGAQPVTATAVSSALGLAQQALRASFPLPEIFPLADGGVQLEWHAGPVELEVAFAPHGLRATFVCDDDQAGQEIDGILPADEQRFALALARLHAHA